MFTFWLATLAFAQTVSSDENSQNLSPVYQLISDAKSIGNQFGDDVWEGYSDAPDTMILISGETEILLCHEGPAEGFVPAFYENISQCARKTRDRHIPGLFPGQLPSD
jgi:hypothetical protein